VAEVRIERIYLGRLPGDKFDDLFCECTVIQGFKLPADTNHLVLRMNFAPRPLSRYEKQTAILFGFENHWGGYSPFGGKRGLILTNEVSTQFELVGSKTVSKKYNYSELLKEIKRISESTKPTGTEGGDKQSTPKKNGESKTSNHPLSPEV